MGYAEQNFAMESRTGSVSSGLGSISGARGQSMKNSPFCPRSASKMTQSIIREHMMSHYKKLYSAKASIDVSVPKSMTHSIRYKDQIRQERLRKGGRPLSARSFSQSERPASCSSVQSSSSMEYDDNLYLNTRRSAIFSPRFSTSFHAKDVVYQSSKGDHCQHAHSASELKLSTLKSTSCRKQSACSLAASGGQCCYKTFQDPVQKTYSGDLLKKHSQHFTESKPFTPKTLKSDKSSYLEKYRYYRAPQRKQTQSTNETNHRSTKTKEQGFDQQSQGFSTEQEWSEDEFSGTYLLDHRQQSRSSKSRENLLFNSSPGFLAEGVKSRTMKKISAEEEELMYLEFISAVTEDILSRGHISDRVLDRVMKHHVDMNRQKLDEGKMRHLLEVLRKDFEEPVNASLSCVELGKKENDLLDSLLPYMKAGGKREKSGGVSKKVPYPSVIQNCNSPDCTDASSVSGFVHSTQRTSTPIQTNEKNEDGDDEDKSTGSPLLSPNVSAVSEDTDNQQDITNEEVYNENHEHSAAASDEESNLAEVSQDGEKVLEDLGRRFSESLQLSSDASCHDTETAHQTHGNTTASDSDDEF